MISNSQKYLADQLILDTVWAYDWNLFTYYYKLRIKMLVEKKAGNRDWHKLWANNTRK